jgi:diaminopimelate epimerase
MRAWSPRIQGANSGKWAGNDPLDLLEQPVGFDQTYPSAGNELTIRLMKYAKLHGCQNAYIYIDAQDLTSQDPTELARQVSAQPPAGIGADGLILYGPSAAADARMTIYNADGSRAAMCGNGVRALGKWILDNDPAAGRMLATATPFDRLGDRLPDLTMAFCRVLNRAQVPPNARLTVRSLSIETDSGVKVITALQHEGAVIAAAVEIGLATLDLAGLGASRPRTPLTRLLNEPLHAAGQEFAITCVAVGNLHAVVFVPDVAAVPLATFGAALESHPLFPDRVNVHFVTIRDRDSLQMRPWERGSGATPACGTGACAALTAAVARGAADLEAEVAQPGGEVWIRLNPLGVDRWNVQMVGPTELVEVGAWPRKG